MKEIVEDIYKKIDEINSNSLHIPEKYITEFSESMGQALLEWSKPRENKDFTLRFSNIGKPARQLWFEKRSPAKQNQPSPTLQIKFLYGHLLEQLLLFLVKLSGNGISAEQKEVEIGGIKGHMDCKINNKVVDIKSASKFSFTKFKRGDLRDDDPFGYITQLAAYEQAEEGEDSYFLVIDKETGELCTYTPEELDKPNAAETIKDLKVTLKNEQPPDYCYPTVEEGKKGNRKIHKNCVYCAYKKECHKDSNNGEGLRVFKYARGKVYFTNVRSIPNVEEIYEW